MPLIRDDPEYFLIRSPIEPNDTHLYEKLTTELHSISAEWYIDHIYRKKMHTPKQLIAVLTKLSHENGIDEESRAELKQTLVTIKTYASISEKACLTKIIAMLANKSIARSDRLYIGESIRPLVIVLKRHNMDVPDFDDESDPEPEESIEIDASTQEVIDYVKNQEYRFMDTMPECRFNIRTEDPATYHDYLMMKESNNHARLMEDKRVSNHHNDMEAKKLDIELAKKNNEAKKLDLELAKENNASKKLDLELVNGSKDIEMKKLDLQIIREQNENIKLQIKAGKSSN